MGSFPTMKDLRAEKEQLTIQKDAQYDTYNSFKDYSQRTPDRVCQCRQHPRRRTRSAAARTAAHAKIRTVPLTSFQSHLETKNNQRIMWYIPHNTLAIRFHLLLIPQHSIFQFNKFSVKDFLQHLSAWYPLQSSDLRCFHYAESGLVMILIKCNE